MKQQFLITGIFGIWHMLRTFPSSDWDIRICGFAWDGWKHHSRPAVAGLTTGSIQANSSLYRESEFASGSASAHFIVSETVYS
jgi:hypothetical protein